MSRKGRKNRERGLISLLIRGTRWRCVHRLTTELVVDAGVTDVVAPETLAVVVAGAAVLAWLVIMLLIMMVEPPWVNVVLPTVAEEWALVAVLLAALEGAVKVVARFCFLKKGVASAGVKRARRAKARATARTVNERIFLSWAVSFVDLGEELASKAGKRSRVREGTKGLRRCFVMVMRKEKSFGFAAAFIAGQSRDA